MIKTVWWSIASAIAISFLALLVVSPILQKRHVGKQDTARRETQVILNTLAYAYDVTRERDGRFKADSIRVDDLMTVAAKFRPEDSHRISIDWFENAGQKGVQGLDGWCRPLEITNRNGRLCIASAGADGVIGTEDDMSEVLTRRTKVDGDRSNVSDTNST